MPRPRQLASDQTPTHIIQQVESANLPPKVAVDEFIDRWNSIFHLFAGGVKLDDSKKPLVKAVLKHFDVLKE